MEVVTARAFSSIENIVLLSEEYMRAGAVLVLPRGKTSLPEVEKIERNRYASTLRVNSLAEGGVFVQIQLRAEK